jgi:hypothetical protein
MAAAAVVCVKGLQLGRVHQMQMVKAVMVSRGLVQQDTHLLLLLPVPSGGSCGAGSQQQQVVMMSRRLAGLKMVMLKNNSSSSSSSKRKLARSCSRLLVGVDQVLQPQRELPCVSCQAHMLSCLCPHSSSSRLQPHPERQQLQGQQQLLGADSWPACCWMMIMMMVINPTAGRQQRGQQQQ